MKERYMCKLCGRDTLSRPGEPHRCEKGFRKRFKAQAKRRGWESCFESIGGGGA